MRLGEYNDMVAYRQTDFGWYLMNEEAEEVLLPNKFVPEGLERGDDLRAFIFLDSDERPTATTQKPLLTVGEFAPLTVVDVNPVGAFVDWGLDKQLLVPYGEQMQELQKGRKAIVYLKVDPVTQRLVGSSKIYRYLDNSGVELEEGAEVDIIVAHSTDLGRNVIVNGRHKGLIFENQIFKDIRFGDRRKAYVKKTHPDGKLDIVLERQGYRKAVDGHSQKILDFITQRGGHMPLHDKSAPEDIQHHLGMSKKSFKKALGKLYKEKKVILEGRKGVRLA